MNPTIPLEHVWQMVESRRSDNLQKIIETLDEQIELRKSEAKIMQRWKEQIIELN